VLERLPLEVQQIIFFNLPDVESMKSISLASSSLYHGFKGFEKHVVTDVFEKELPLDVLPELLVILKTLRIPNRTKRRVQIFAHINLRLRRPRHWWNFSELFTLSEALFLRKLRRSALYFAEDFGLLTRRRPGSETPFQGSDFWATPIEHPPLSQTETSHIVRALYRYEIYCDLFRDDLFSVKEQQDVFFKRFSVFENEQVACIDDYLAMKFVFGRTFFFCPVNLQC
jgi:hypothetical protein